MPVAEVGARAARGWCTFRAVVPRSIVIAPGAEENPLATWARDALRRREAPEGVRRQRQAELVRATVGFVATDRRLAVTLRFDRGAVVVHDGSVGTPDVTFCGRFDALMALGSLPMTRLGELPLSSGWLGVMGDWVSEDLTIYGLLTHPRLTLRVLRLLAPPPR